MGVSQGKGRNQELREEIDTHRAEEPASCQPGGCYPGENQKEPGGLSLSVLIWAQHPALGHSFSSWPPGTDSRGPPISFYLLSLLLNLLEPFLGLASKKGE